MITSNATIARSLRALSLLSLLALTACAGSQRFAPPLAGGGAYGQPQQQALPPVPAVSSAPVTSQPLPPPGGYPAAQAPGGLGELPAEDPFFEGGGGSSGQPAAPAGVETLRGGSGQIATLGAGAGSGSSRGAVSSRDGVIGNWTAQEATGGSCRVQLSSSPALDLYRASASGCTNRDLQKVTAWDYRDGEVYLYQQGGTVVARLRTQDGGAMSGAVTKSGAALSMRR